MIREAIILAGGLGTRLREAIPDLPKCLAPIGAKPFISYLVQYLQQQHINHFVFSLGYKHRLVEQYIHDHFPKIKHQFSVEEKQLGTGGAILQAAAHCKKEDVLVVNADTLFRVDLLKLHQFHHQHQADCTLSLKPMYDTDRYGMVEINKDGHVQSFQERSFQKVGLINGGVYALKLQSILNAGLPAECSFEKDYLKNGIGIRTLMGLVQDEYFIDIGVPADLKKANAELVQ